MRFDRPAMAPSSDDNVDPLPEGQIDPVNSAEVIKQSHPESGEGFVIKAVRMVSSCEIASFVAHPGESLVPRKLRQVTQCHRDVGDVSKVGSGNGGVLECLHELCDFRVAGKTLCFQIDGIMPASCKSGRWKGNQSLPLPLICKRTAALLRLGGIHFTPNNEEKNRADDRHDYPRRMK